MFNHQTKTVTFAALLLAVSGFLSRVLGLLRDRLLASHFGAGRELDIYFAAFRIPDFIYGILILGGITVAFLPVFSEYFRRKEENQENAGWPREALDFVNNVLNLFFVFLIIVCGILVVFAPLVVNFIIPGFSLESKGLTIALTRIMLLSPIFFGLSSIFSGILQYFNRFLVYSLAPILYNIGIIFGILFLVPRFGVYGLAFGVISGAFLHWAIQIPAALASGYRYKLFLDFQHFGIRKIFKLMVPRTIGVAINQINLVVVTALASVLAAGSIAIFNFSNNIQYFPIGIIGVSFAVSSFPVFSRFIANGQRKEFLEHLSSSARQVIFFIFPISLLFFILRAQIIRLILGAGRFSWEDTRLTAACLGIFCLGILTESLIALLCRAFFSLQDTKTPVLVGMVSVLSNIVLCLLFIFLLGHPNFFQQAAVGVLKLQNIQNVEVIGLPLGLSLASIIQFSLLLFFFRKKIGGFEIKDIIRSLKKVLIAGFLMAVSCYAVRVASAGFIDMQTFWGVFLQAACAALVGILVYLFSADFLRSPELHTVKTSLLRQFKKEGLQSK